MTIKGMILAILAIAFCSQVSAYARPNVPASWQPPAPTETLELQGRAHLHVSPRPTDSSIVNNRFRALHDRQDDTASLGTWKADKTCGWWTDNGLPLTCGDPGYSCANSGSFRSCCTGMDCWTSKFTTACFDATACPAKPGSLTKCCTADPVSDHCVTYLWQTTKRPGTVFTLFNCDLAQWAGQTIIAPTAPSTVSSTTTTSSSTTSSSSSSSSVSDSDSTSTSTLSTTSSLTSSTTTSSAPSTPSTPVATDSSEDPDSGGNKPPLGAIIGGVLGGVALIGLFAAISFFIVRRGKQHATKENDFDSNEKTAPGPPNPPNYPNPGMEPQPTIPTIVIPPQSPEFDEPVSPRSPPPVERQYVAYHPALVPAQQHEAIQNSPSPEQRDEAVHHSPSPEAGTLQPTAGVAQDKRLTELEGQGKRYSELEGWPIVELPA